MSRAPSGRQRSARAATAAVARTRKPKAAALPTPAQSAQGYATVALVLQGGGALGAYQCGVYEGLHAAGLRPNWFVGTSIGAINAAILAGNPPERRVARLHEFWDTICQPAGGARAIAAGVRAWLGWMPPNDALDAWANSLGALGALLFGQQGFFGMRLEPPFLFDDGSPRATSFYDTAPLRATLERCVDFGRINARGAPRLTVSATEVETGNVRYFDSASERIRPEHIMASGALPPAFPAIEVEGKHYWDGGLVSNTPLERVWEDIPRRDSLVLQVDVWSARGDLPCTVMDVLERKKDIQYSSCTRLGTDAGARLQRMRHAVGQLLAKVSADQIGPALRRTLQPLTCDSVFNIVHLIYRAKRHEAEFKDYAFGLGTQHAHWADGLADMQQTLEHPDFFMPPPRATGVATHDVHRIVAARRDKSTRGARRDIAR